MSTNNTRTALRRSRRAPPKKPENFQVGQVVELNRLGETSKIKLTQLLTGAGTTMHPRWLVEFLDGHMEEVYEHRLGKILVKAEGEDDSTPDSRRSSASNSPVPPETKPTVPVKKPNGRAASPSHSSSGKNSPSSETDPEGKKKSVSFHGHQQPQPKQTPQPQPPIESDEGESADKVSAREERSRRRQAMIDEVPASSGTSAGFPGVPPLKRKNSNSSHTAKNAKKRPRHESASDEPVTKVKFLTGTLLLYRGRHRRAEFVRRV